MDGGALFALTPVYFSVMLPIGGEEVKESRTTMTGNMAGAKGGGIATWAPLSLEFGHSLVCIHVQAVYLGKSV
jgi:hypothetical protein